MDKKETSTEISNFILYNKQDIANLININPEIADAFSKVLIALDNEYGSGDLQNINDTVTTNSYLGRMLYRGDFIPMVESLNVNVLSYDFIKSEATDYPLKNLHTFSRVKDGGLVVMNVVQYDNKYYYLTAFWDDLNPQNLYKKDGIKLEEFLAFLLEINEVDNQLKLLSISDFRVGSYLIPSFADLYGNNVKEIYDYVEKKKGVITKSIFTVGAFYENVIKKEYAQIIDIKKYEDENFVEKKYYVIKVVGLFAAFYIEVSIFDNEFSQINSICDNDVYDETTVYAKMYGLRPVINDGKLLLNLAIYDRNSDLTNDVDLSFSSTIEIRDYFSANYTKYRNETSRLQKLTEFEEKLSSVITFTKKPSNDTFVPTERMSYVLSAKANTGNRKSPTESATTFVLGTLLIGNDLNLWVVRETKTSKRWEMFDNTLKDFLPDALKNKTILPSLKDLQKIEKDLFDAMQYFDATDDEYRELQNQLGSVQKYIKYDRSI
jgi:hypothetical protein